MSFVHSGGRGGSFLWTLKQIPPSDVRTQDSENRDFPGGI